MKYLPKIKDSQKLVVEYERLKDNVLEAKSNKKSNVCTNLKVNLRNLRRNFRYADIVHN
jgi:hypothetical protein